MAMMMMRIALYCDRHVKCVVRNDAYG
jgi:hypothetical protein